jgi:large subunit ribosomal protein L24
MKIKKGDKVKVITGKDKGIEGLVTKVILAEDRVVVEGVRVQKKAFKNKEAGNTENFIYVQHPIHVSNVRKVEGEVKKVEAKKKATKGEKKTKSKSK